MSVHHRFHLLNVNINKKKKKKKKKRKGCACKVSCEIMEVVYTKYSRSECKEYFPLGKFPYSHTHTHTLTHENFATVGATKWVVSLSGVEPGIFVWGGQVQR